MKKVLGVVMAAAVAVALTGCSGFDDERQPRQQPRRHRRITQGAGTLLLKA